jgi:hypothetical protein
MAKGAKKAASKKAEKTAKPGSMRPVLLAAGLGLYWFVEYQDLGGQPEAAPIWGHMVVLGVRLLADFVGAWFIVAGLQLAIMLLRLTLSYLRNLWVREGA